LTVLIDSWAWIEYFKGTPFGKSARDYIEGGDEIVVSSMNIAEVYRFLIANRPQDSARFIDFMIKTSFVSFLTTEIAIEAARHKHEKKMGMADAIVLATAVHHKAKIVTGDDDFKGMGDVVYIPGLTG